jgi:hypothetical protein
MSTHSDFPLVAPGTRKAASWAKRALLLLPLGCVTLLAGVFLAPRLQPSSDPGDDFTRNTVRVSLLFWFAAVWLMLGLATTDRRTATIVGKAARLCWTLAWLVYLLHLAMAMHFYHGWSHADAVRHVHDVSGFGRGIFFSHLFTLLWSADVAWWWLDRAAYACRWVWIDRGLHAYMVFIVFNATVIYESGFIRWAGVVMLALLALRFASRLLTLRGRTT